MRKVRNIILTSDTYNRRSIIIKGGDGGIINFVNHGMLSTTNEFHEIKQELELLKLEIQLLKTRIE